MPAIVSACATFPPSDMPIWARLRLITEQVRFESVSHWQPTGDGEITCWTPYGHVYLYRYAR